ncbi:CREB3 regulatory factor-like [Watersipora subatra]|uniref:CREB3 regulatory factor-like n=1 Tax=Watersipora subatra TaxID=2589382 RepID=UPI00355C3DD1
MASVLKDEVVSNEEFMRLHNSQHGMLCNPKDKPRVAYHGCSEESYVQSKKSCLKDGSLFHNRLDCRLSRPRSLSGEQSRSEQTTFSSLSADLPTKAFPYPTHSDSDCFSAKSNLLKFNHSTNNTYKNNLVRSPHRARSAPPFQTCSLSGSNDLASICISSSGDSISKVTQLLYSPKNDRNEYMLLGRISSSDEETPGFSNSGSSSGLAGSPVAGLAIIEESQEQDLIKAELRDTSPGRDSCVSEDRLELVLPDSDNSSTISSLSSDEDEEIPCTIPLLPSDDENSPSASNQPLLPATIFDEDLPEGSARDVGENSFWTKNSTTKGPKSRMQFEIDVKDPGKNPHKPIVYQDPMYDKSQPTLVRHRGRARVGNGNDTTVDPAKLIKLGLDLENERQKMVSLSSSTKNRKERNRRSSRICRLKRLARHEANKVKAAGLEREREGLSSVITKVNDKLMQQWPPEEGFMRYLNNLKDERLELSVAGRTEEYVKEVLGSSDGPILLWSSDTD